MTLNLDTAFETFMATVYKKDPVPRDSVQWSESQRVFIAGVHAAACAIKNDKNPRLTATLLSQATLSFANSTKQKS